MESNASTASIDALKAKRIRLLNEKKRYVEIFDEEIAKVDIQMKNHKTQIDKWFEDSSVVKSIAQQRQAYFMKSPK